MQREDRYIIAKISETNTALNATEQTIFSLLLDKIAAKRFMSGKAPLNCVVVEDDWPEYETVWKMIADRVDGTPNAKGLSCSTVKLFDLLDDLRTEADLCRNETADDIANLLDRAADEIGRLRAELDREQFKNHFDAVRLRRVATLMGVSLPESEETLLGCAGTVLGSIAREIERTFKAPNV